MKASASLSRLTHSTFSDDWRQDTAMRWRVPSTRRGIIPDMVTDQTSAHDALNGYIPAGLSPEEAEELRKRDPQAYIKRSVESMVAHVRAMLEMQKMGAVVFDYGNNLRGQALAAGETHALDFPGFVPAYIR